MTYKRERKYPKMTPEINHERQLSAFSTSLPSSSGLWEET